MKDASGKYCIDYNHLNNTVRVAIRFLDDVIDVNHYPIQEIHDMVHKARKIGLGVMGFADVLLKMNIRYGSDESLVLAEQIMSTIQDTAWEFSKTLAVLKGSYPFHPDSGVRNNTVTTIAPTGTLSIIADCSSGIEPLFSLGYYRNVMDGTKLPFINEELKSRLYETTLLNEYDADVLIDAIIQNKGTFHNLMIPWTKFTGEYTELQKNDIVRFVNGLSEVFVCAHDITPEEHIKVQAAFQKHVDNAISKTINFSNDATEDDVRRAYLLAYKLGCKGTTIYRDGCRENQVLNNYTSETPKGEGLNDQKPETPDSFFDLPNERKISYLQEIASDPESLKSLNHYLDIGETKSTEKEEDRIPRDRPESVTGFTKKVPIGCGNLYVTVNHDEHGVCEIFTNTGKSGGCPSQSEAAARLASIALRSGVSIDEVIHQLRGIRCPACQRNPKVKVLSCPDAIGRMLEEAKKQIENTSVKQATRPAEFSVGKPVETPDTTPISRVDPVIASAVSDADLKFASNCPECGAPLEHEGGCVMCRECGWSKCN